MLRENTAELIMGKLLLFFFCYEIICLITTNLPFDKSICHPYGHLLQKQWDPENKEMVLF